MVERIFNLEENADLLPLAGSCSTKEEKESSSVLRSEE